MPVSKFFRTTWRYLMVALILAVGIIFAFNFVNKPNSTPNLYQRKILSDKEHITGESIYFINSVFPSMDHTIKARNLLLVTNIYSCHGCNVEGEHLIQGIKDIPVYIFALDDRDEKLKIRTEHLVTSDSVFQYVRKLNNIDTPVILAFTDSFIVTNAFFPGTESQKEFDMLLSSVRYENNVISSHTTSK